METMTREDYLRHVSGKRSGKPRRRHNPDRPIVVPPDVRRVLAIDPGQKLGWAVVDIDDSFSRKLIRIDSGRWSPSSAKNVPDKRTQLWAHLRELASLYVGPDKSHNGRDPGSVAIAIELPNPNGLARGQAFSRTSLVSYGMGIGVVLGTMLSFHQLGAVLCPSVEQWKGRKSKEQTAAEAEMLTGYRSDDDNEMDAIALAAWVLRQV